MVASILRLNRCDSHDSLPQLVDDLYQPSSRSVEPTSSEDTMATVGTWHTSAASAVPSNPPETSGVQDKVRRGSLSTGTTKKRVIIGTMSLLSKGVAMTMFLLSSTVDQPPNNSMTFNRFGPLVDDDGGAPLGMTAPVAWGSKLDPNVFVTGTGSLLGDVVRNNYNELLAFFRDGSKIYLSGLDGGLWSSTAVEGPVEEVSSMLLHVIAADPGA